MTVLDWEQDCINRSIIRKTRFDDFIKKVEHSNLEVFINGKFKK